MRTTLDIDDDVLQAAKELARAEKKTAGQVISELARKALIQPIGLPDMDKIEIRNGFTLLPRRGGIVTNELVKTIQEQIDREEHEDALALRRKRPDRTS
jgi:hypothetical protein